MTVRATVSGTVLVTGTARSTVAVTVTGVRFSSRSWGRTRAAPPAVSLKKQPENVKCSHGWLAWSDSFLSGQCVDLLGGAY